jgi:long-chain fatty acid transport protein
VLRNWSTFFVTFGIALATVLPTHLFAIGIQVPDQDAFATARGGAFVATADNPSAIYYNPAGISQLDGINASAGFYGIFLNSHYQNGSDSVNTRQKLLAIPQLFLTARLPETPVTVGLGVYAPFGLGLEWPDNAPFLASPNVPKKAQIEFITINPVMAWKPLKTLSISAGPTFNFVETEFIFRPFGSPANTLRFRGRDDDTGFNAGVLWQPLKQHSFGVSYHSETTMKLVGHSETQIQVPPLLPAPFTESAGVRISFPQSVRFGYSYRPTEQWNFELNADWTDWSVVKTFALNKSVTGLQTVPLEWRSSWFYELGTTRYLKSGWRVSGGYTFARSSVPTSTFNPIVPDSDRHVFAIGVGRTYKCFSWDATYQFDYGPEQSVSGQTGFNSGINGQYTWLSHSLALTFGYHF